jgi:uncharacterized SAM-binding protein YcdF (DUF218 family)
MSSSYTTLSRLFPMRRNRRRWPLRWIMLALIIYAAFFYVPKNAGCWLVSDESPKSKPDYYAVLMGDPMGKRVDAMLEKYQTLGPAPILLTSAEASKFELTGLIPDQATLNQMYLLKQSIPKEQIRFLSEERATSTTEEAEMMIRYVLQSHGTGPVHLSVATSWYHTSRSLYAFRQVAKKLSATNVQFSVIAAETEVCRTWLNDELSFLMAFQEYLKWLYYLLNH